MEGTPDAPKSELSMNVVKMLTQVQAAEFLSIDVLTHPAILGYTVSKSQRTRAPHLYKDAQFFADSAREGALACSRDLEVEAVLPADIIADVGDLDNHRLPHKLRVRATPIVATWVVPLIGEVELVALAAIL